MNLLDSVRSLLNGKGHDVWSVSPQRPVYEALKLMADKHIGALLVMSANSKLVGLISERDYARKVILRGKSSMTTEVQEIMSTPVAFVAPDNSVQDCMRIMYQPGPEFEGLTPGAAWEDAKVGLHSLRLFDGCAVVTDVAWIRESTGVAKFFMPCPAQVFANQEFDKAIAWLTSLPEGAAVSHRVLPHSGVIVVEVKQALRAQDFDALAFTADNWIEAHGYLQGLVIHAREFPGWENFGSFLRHLRFVRNHHREVKRIAFAADSKLASFAPEIGGLFIQAELKSFGYEELDIAIAWAARPATQQAASPQSASN